MFCSFHKKNKYMSCRKLLLASVMFLFSVGCLHSCKKDNVYKTVVKVSMLDEFNVKISVPECKLVFGEDHFAPDVKRIGYTDASGKYEGEWNREVTLPVHASRVINDKVYSGYSVIRPSQEGVSMHEILIKPE